MDRKRRYVNRALRAGDLREDRAAKRRERTAGNAEIRVDVEAMVDEAHAAAMIRVNLAAKEPCPKCGASLVEGFDGSTDTPYEVCERVQYSRGKSPLYCGFEARPARWLAQALRGVA